MEQQENTTEAQDTFTLFCHDLPTEPAPGLGTVLVTGVSGYIGGRRNQYTLQVGDVVEFRRVEDIRQGKRLLLRAEMNMPGMAWLEFSVEPKNGKNRLSIFAHFYTRPFFGKAYWYVFMPFHNMIFKDLIKRIEHRS